MRTVRSRVFLLAAAIALGVGAAAAAPPNDRAAAEATLKEVETSAKKDVATEMVGRSRAALARASQLRASGDEAHAQLAEGLARTWAEAARDVVRAVDLEEKAQASRRAATDAGAAAQRERALLEEGIAQSGRLRAQIEAATRESQERPARTSIAATASAEPTSKTAPAKAPAKATARDGGTP